MSIAISEEDTKDASKMTVILNASKDNADYAYY